MKRTWLVVVVIILAGLAVLVSRPLPVAATRLAQSTGYPAPGTPSLFPSETLAFDATLDLTGTPGGSPFPPEPTLAVSPGPNLFRTEDAAIFDSFATLAGNETLPATRTPTVTRTATVTRTPTPTHTATLTFTPSATGSTVTPTVVTPTGRVTGTATPGAISQSIDWKIFGIGFSIPLLVIAAGAIAILLGQGRKK